MKCRTCGEKAVIRLRAHNTGFCKADYLAWFRKHALRTVRRFRMMGREDRVLVAVSGGKDSLALWHLLAEAGYEADGLYIAQGIGSEALPYSDRSEEACRKASERLGRPLCIVSVEEETGATVPELRRYTRRKICSACGLVKRYLMNREAYEGGYDVLATGHNLDDEVAVLFGNVLGWDLDRLAHQSPVSPRKSQRLVKKVKPLCFFPEREVLAYTLLHRLPYMAEECPHAAGATSIAHKELWNRLENESPGTKRRFYAEFLRNREAFDRARPEVDLGTCQRCGMATTAELCSYCRMVERVAEEKGRVVYRGLPEEEATPESHVVTIQ